ncbi:hypothetical protein EDC02_4971 [Micromonospora sp. Llam0]|uniref:hypothetical protein n=1 Tax=Micromonospora sp. Llam0 TaxID=2485143 RepID=UPI000FC35748|nr:hypothetical protein [Micromonospora sp. Llam0]ROO62962.1 hypothetical protein EDC02_4971 [Micromonospora sp. Llam0]
MRRELFEVLVMALTLLITAAALGWLGVENLATALTYAGWLTGALLILAAAFLLLATFAIWDYLRLRKFARAELFVLLGCVVALIANTSLFVIAIKRFGGGLASFLWGALAIVSAWAAWKVYRHCIQVPVPQKVGFAVAVATIITLANFGYSRIFEPSAASPRVQVMAEFGDPTRLATGGARMPVSLSVENAGEVDVHVFGAVYSVLGRKASLTPRGIDQNQAHDSLKKALEGRDEFSSQVTINGYELVQADLWVPFNSLLVRGTKIKVEKVVWISAEADFDEVALLAEAFIARKDRMIIEDSDQGPRLSEASAGLPEWVSGGKEYPYRVNRVRIIEGDAVARLSSESRYLTMWWVLRSPDPYLEVNIASKETDSRPSGSVLHDLRKRYGFFNISTEWTEKAMPE